MATKNIKIINGKLYNRFASSLSKKLAMSVAKGQRSSGKWYARIVQEYGDYAVYLKKK